MEQDKNPSELPAPEEYMSDVRYIASHAHGTEYKPINNYSQAKEREHSYVIMEGDYGGQIYLTCPMKLVNCAHETLLQLATDLDNMYWQEAEGCRVFYEEYAEPQGVWGGMSGGLVDDGLWMHPEFESADIENRVWEVLQGQRARADITIFDVFHYNKNDKEAPKMCAYMRHQFPFLGIRPYWRKEHSRLFFKSVKKTDLDWDFVSKCWTQPEREFQYLAMDYLSKQKANLTAADMPKLRELLVTKSWWDTTDELDAIVGFIALRFPETIATLLAWSTDENIWLRRVAINHQLGRKEKTDTVLLAQMIINNLGQTEFFINKAIGWALRDYSKINPDWVRAFIADHQHQMVPLSIKEAGKYI